MGDRVKKNQLVKQLVLCIFRQPLHVSDISKPIISCCIHMLVHPDDGPRYTRNM